MASSISTLTLNRPYRSYGKLKNLLFFCNKNFNFFLFFISFIFFFFSFFFLYITLFITQAVENEFYSTWVELIYKIEKNNFFL
jgi:hypothetical protein